MSDELNGFDMVWAITQHTLNAQLAWQMTRPASPGQPDLAHVNFGELYEADGKTVRDGFHVEALLGTPSIEIPEGNTTTVDLFVPFASGTLQHLSDVDTSVSTVDLTPDPKDPAATTWTFCFAVDLNLADITPHLDCTAGKPPPNMHQETYDKLCKFTSSGFSISQLFLSFENVDLARYLPDRSTIPSKPVASITKDGVTAAGQPDPRAAQLLEQAMLLYFDDLKADPNLSPYILGYTANTGASEPAALQPTATRFSTYQYQPAAGAPKQPGLSTLNLLLMTDHRTPPGENLSFNYNLVARPGIDGTARIASSVVAHDWLDNMSQGGVSLIRSLAWSIGFVGQLLTYDPARHQWSRTWEIGKTQVFPKLPSKQHYKVRMLSIALARHVTDAQGRSGPGLTIQGASGQAFYLYEPGHGDGTVTHLLPWSLDVVMLPGAGQDSATIALSPGILTEGHPQIRTAGKFGEVSPEIAERYLGPLLPVERIEVDRVRLTIGNALQGISNQIVLPTPATVTYHDLRFDDEFTLIADFAYVTS